jgi:hypothetical protein
LSDAYLRTLDTLLPAGVVDERLDAAARLPAGADPDAAVGSAVLADRKLGPVARNVVLMWYCGTWRALPDTWRAVYGDSPLDVDHVVSAEAYQGGLQWVAAGAHPAGALQQGFGAWASAPGEGPA